MNYKFISLTIKKILFITLFLLSLAVVSRAQDILIVDEINLSGNKKTKDFIILRELDIKLQDTLLTTDTSTVFTRNELKIFNTTLFLNVEIKCTESQKIGRKKHVSITIELKERWYIFPLPILELADRNFNVWRTQHNADLKRIEWGIRFDHENFRGRNEKLQITLQAGFTKKYEVFHEIPYLNKKKTIGINYGLSYSTNKSVGYTQENNILLFLNSNDILRKRFYSTFSLRFRPKFYQFHELGINYHQNKISTELLNSTSFYLNENQLEQKYTRLFYRFKLNKTDINYYPLKGYDLRIELLQNGLGLQNKVNQSTIKLNLSKYFPLSKRLNLASRLTLKATSLNDESYILQEGLGYNEDFVRGYQPYVIDGQSLGLWRNELKFNFLNFSHDFGKMVPIKQFREVPYSFYVKLFSDYGITNNQIDRLNADLQNKLISGHGIGIDIVSYYDLVLRVEYAVNQELENGFYLHLGKAI